MVIVRSRCDWCRKAPCVCETPAPGQKDSKPPKEPTLHDQLVIRAERWLKSQGCGVVIRDPFRCVISEQPDAIGWRSGVSIMIEVKTSRSDFHADKKKSFRRFPQNGIGDWRLYMCPPKLIIPSDLPEGWGLLWCYDKKITKEHGLPKGNTDWTRCAPFNGCDFREKTMLLSALRRLEIRGYLPEIYDGIPTNTQDQG